MLIIIVSLIMDRQYISLCNIHCYVVTLYVPGDNGYEIKNICKKMLLTCWYCKEERQMLNVTCGTTVQ